MLLKDITALRGPSGWEDEARNAIRKEAQAILDGREAGYTAIRWAISTLSARERMRQSPT